LLVVNAGEIFDYLITNGRMKESDVKTKFRQVFSKLENKLFKYFFVIVGKTTVVVV